MLRPWNAPVSLPGWVSCLLYSCFYPGRPPWKATLQALTIHTSAYRFTAAYRTVRTCWLRFFPLFAFFLSSLFLTSLTFLYLSVSSTCVHHHLLHLRVLFPLYKVLSWFVLSQPFPPINLSWLLSLLDPLSLSLSLSLSLPLSLQSGTRGKQGREALSRYRFAENLLHHFSTAPFSSSVSLLCNEAAKICLEIPRTRRSFVTRNIGKESSTYSSSFFLLPALSLPLLEC